MSPRPRPRSSRSPTGADGRVDRRLVGIAVATAAVIAVAVVGVVLGGDASAGDASEARAALETAGCTLTEVAALEGADHSIADPDGRSDRWNTDPPTSGPHFAETLIYAAYGEPIQQARALHNLEHGAITIQYGSAVPAATVEQLQGFYDRHRNGTILAPYPRLGTRIALSAWNASSPSARGVGVQATCIAFDEDAYAAYFAAFQFRGPERFHPGAMAPGSR